MNQLKFKVRFHGPFAVATGEARDGMDTTIDESNPLPSTAIKGLLKAQLRDVLAASPGQIATIFHSGDKIGWVFSDAKIDVKDKKGLWTRVQVDDEGRSSERQFMVGEQAHPETGEFVVVWEGGGEAPVDQALALRAAARCLTSLGSHRRRGLGWVSITDEAEWTIDDTKNLRAWLNGQAGA